MASFCQADFYFKKVKKACIKDKDLVLKIHNGHYGIGDRFLEYGTHFSTPQDLEDLIKSDNFYDGREILVLDWIRPKEDMGVHQLEILTMNSDDEGFKGHMSTFPK